MTIAATTSRTSAVASNTAGQTIDYTFGAADGELKVYKRVTTTGVETELVEGADDGYTATYSDTGGTVTITAAVPVTYTIIIYRDTPMTQTLDLEDGGDFSAENIEDAFDKAVRLIQENAEDAKLSIRAPKDDPLATDLVLPSSIDRANTYLAFDADGNVELATSATTSSTSTRTSTDIITKGPWHDVRAYGAVGDGTTDDAAAIQLAITAAGTDGYVYFPKTGDGYVVQSTGFTVASPMHIFSNGASIIFDFDDDDTTNTKLFYITSSDVTIEGFIFDGANITGETHDTNRYLIQAAGTAGTHIKNVHVRNCKFTQLDPHYDVNNGDGLGVRATHGVYFNYCDESTVQDCWFDDQGGAAVFIKNSDNTKVLCNFIRDCRWYPIHYDQACDGFEIAHNWIGGTTALVRNFGGSIDIMSQSTGAPEPMTRGIIHHNYITGLHHDDYPYGMRISSLAHATISDNMIDGCTTTTGTTIFHGIFVTARPSSTHPAKDITITGNVLIAGQTLDSAITIWPGNDQTTVSENFVVANNVIYSSTTKYWGTGIILHGPATGTLGIDNVNIANNVIYVVTGGETTFPEGGIGVVGYITAHVDNVKIVGNHIEHLGAPGDTDDCGIVIDQYSDNIEIFDNTVDNFYYGVRLGSNVGGPLIGDVWFRGNRIRNSLTSDYYYPTMTTEKIHNSKYDFVEFVAVDNAPVMLDNQMVTINGSL